MIKLAEWAKREGISRSLAYKMYIAGTIPHATKRLSERVILVDVPDDYNKETQPKKVVAYIRVSTSKQQESLNKQKLRVLEYAVKNGYKLDEIIEEIGSGINENRKKLIKILKDPTIGTIIVEHRERLARINYRLIEEVLKSRGTEIIVIDKEEIRDTT